MSIRNGLALIALCVVPATAGFFAYRLWQPEAAQVAPVMRPDLAFKDLDGRTRALAEWDGQLVLLNFWATWCAPCLKEIPLLIEAQQRHAARGLQIVGLAADQAEPVRRFQERFGINYPLLIGEAEIFAAMDAMGDTLGALPFSVLIARDGRILERFHGAFTAQDLEDLLSAHL